MRVSLRTQIVLVVELLICVILGTNTLIVIQHTKRNALQLMAWRSDVMIRNIPGAIPTQRQDTPDIDGIVEQQINGILIQSAIVFGVSLVVSFLAVSGVMHIRFITPIRKLTTAGQQLAEGRLVQTFQIGQQSAEIADLAVVFENLTCYWQKIATVSSEIAYGVFSHKEHVRSAHDILGNTLSEMAQYLRQTAVAATKMKDGDFTATIQVRSPDDLFGQEFQAMALSVNDLLGQTKMSLEQMTTTGTSITAAAERELSTVQDAHASVEAMLSTMTEIETSAEEVMHNMETFSSSVEETSASVAQMTTSITQIASHTQKLTRQTQETAAFLDMTVSALQEIINMTETSQQFSQETMQNALGGQQAVEQIMASMSVLQHTITTGVEAITTFAHRSREIDMILDVIQEITERTSLLALNASIIAAQAGIHGRGFAVVADEIKNLALGVTTSTKDIAAIVRSLQQDIQHVVESIHTGVADVKQGMERTQQAQGALQTILVSAKHSSEKVITIVAALDELMATSQEVSSSMGQVNLMTEEMTTATKEHESSTKQIHQAIAHINDMTAHIQHATAQQSAGAHQALNTTHTMLDLIDQNLESSRQIVLTAEELSAQITPLLQAMSRLTLRS